jgi:hypothetical protein
MAGVTVQELTATIFKLYSARDYAVWLIILFHTNSTVCILYISLYRYFVGRVRPEMGPAEFEKILRKKFETGIVEEGWLLQ